MNKKQTITRPLLYSTKECRELGIHQYKLKKLVNLGLLQRIKSRLNKNNNYYLKEEINNLLSEFYVESK